MADQETNRKIDTARDILVGKLPNPQAQVEQITIALIYKFMDDMDKEAMEFGGVATFFTGEFEKYGWSKIFDPKLGGYEMLALYGEAIVKLNQNPNIPQLFRDIFKNAFLPYRDPETLKMFLKVINEFHYDHSEKLGDAFEYLLSVLGSQGDAGQFRTPRHIIDFMVAIVQPKKDESVCDPACGTAGFLISSYKYILNQNTKKNKGDLLTPDDRKKLFNNFIGYDISAEMVRLSLVNLYLHGFTTPKIFEYDTLTSEDRWGDYFDIVLANPPFMTPKGGIRPHKKFAMQANRSEVLFVDYIMEHINPTTGRGAVIVPEGIIFQSATAYKALRKLLVDKNFLYGVVSLPAGLFQPYSGVKTSILLLDKSLAKKTDKILFVKIENDGYGLGAQRRELTTSDLPDAANFIQQYIAAIRNNDFTNIDLEKLPLNSLIVEKEKIAENDDYNLSADRYKLAKAKRPTKYDMFEIGEICNLINGRAFKPEDWEAKETGGIPIIRIQNLNNKNAEFNYYSGEIIDKFIVNNGDLLFSWSGSKGTSFGAHFWYGDKAVLNQHIFRIEHSEQVTKQYLYYALNEAVTEIEENLHGGVGLVHITKGNMERIKIPVPPLSIQQEIVSKIEQFEKIITGAKQVVENYKPQIDINPEWEMVELGSVCETEYGFTDTAKENGDARYIRITDIDENGKLKNTDFKYLELSDDAKKFLLKANDIVVARTGATFGKTLLFNENYSAVFASYLIRLKFNTGKVNPKYYWCFSQSENYWNQANALMTGGGQPQFNANAIVKIQLPIPTLPEQQTIVSQIEKEQKLVNANKELITIYEQKIKDEINKLWAQ